MRGAFRVAGVLALSVASLVSASSTGDQDVIDYRQHIMKTLNEQSAAVGQILSDAIPADNLGAHLQIISLTASTALKSFEPKIPGGEAKPEVWTRWDDFSKRMNEFAQKTAAAAKAASQGAGKDELSESIIDALSCKSCHEKYRTEKKH